MSKTIYQCPVCNKTLYKSDDEKMMKCSNKHSFDQAKQGYFNLLLSNTSKDKTHGDSKEMLEARKEILYGRYYEIVSDAVNSIIKDLTKDKDVSYRILDIGSGIGYYLTRLNQTIHKDTNEYYGIDISKDGIKESSKNDKSSNWIVASNNNLPIEDDSMDIVLSVFSPINEEECQRVLKKDGKLLVVYPNQDHLIELKREIYKDIILKDEFRNELLSKTLINISRKEIEKNILLSKDQIKSLFMMTPHYWTSTQEGKNNLYFLNELNIKLDITIDVYENKKP